MNSTKDYSIFKQHPSNRVISQTNLHKIEASIKQKNLLDLRPIIVNQNMEIIDGQHRLIVAKKLDLEVYYTIQENATGEDMVLLNNAQKNWDSNDFLAYYVSIENEDYKRLKEFMTKNNLSVSNSLAIVLGIGSRNHSTFQFFREGKFKFPDEARVEEIKDDLEFFKSVIAYIKKKTAGPKAYLKGKAFFAAIIEFFGSKYVEKEIFMSKLQYRIDLLHPCTTKSGYVGLFRVIYNFRNNNPIESL
jgi:hypothetical protein